MPAKLTLHPPERASRFLVIRDGESLVVGRDPACGLVLKDPRVSKRHARFVSCIVSPPTGIASASTT